MTIKIVCISGRRDERSLLSIIDAKLLSRRYILRCLGEIFELRISAKLGKIQICLQVRVRNNDLHQNLVGVIVRVDRYNDVLRNASDLHRPIRGCIRARRTTRRFDGHGRIGRSFFKDVAVFRARHIVVKRHVRSLSVILSEHFPCDLVRIGLYNQCDRGIRCDVRKRYILRTICQLIHTGFTGRNRHVRRLRSSRHGNKLLATGTGYRVVGSGLGDIGDLLAGNRNTTHTSVQLIGVVHLILIPIERSIDIDGLVCTHLGKRRKTIITAIGHGGLRHAALDSAPALYLHIIAVALLHRGRTCRGIVIRLTLAITLVDDCRLHRRVHNGHLCVLVRRQAALTVSALHQGAL